MSLTRTELLTVFDAVLLREDGVWKHYPPGEFLSLPLSVRIRHVIERTVRFQLDEQDVEQKAALAAIRQLHATAASA